MFCLAIFFATNLSLSKLLKSCLLLPSTSTTVRVYTNRIELSAVCKENLHVDELESGRLVRRSAKKKYSVGNEKREKERNKKTTAGLHIDCQSTSDSRRLRTASLFENTRSLSLSCRLPVSYLSSVIFLFHSFLHPTTDRQNLARNCRTTEQSNSLSSCCKVSISSSSSRRVVTEIQVSFLFSNFI